jgi:excisionase family DNA binding protein
MPHQLTLTVAIDDLMIERFVDRVQSAIVRAIKDAIGPTDKGKAPLMSAVGDPHGELLDVGQVAEMLAVSKSHVRRMVQGGIFPKPVHLGRLVRWKAEELRHWVEAERGRS